MTDAENGETIVQFKWHNRTVSLRASWKGYANALLKAHPPRGYGTQRQRAIDRAHEQAKISVCSVLRDWTKGQITAVECGVMSFEAAFMPHMLLPTGERVIDRVQSEKMLPAPDEKVVDMKVKAQS